MVNGDTVGVKIGGAGHGDHVEYFFISHLFYFGISNSHMVTM